MRSPTQEHSPAQTSKPGVAGSSPAGPVRKGRGKSAGSCCRHRLRSTNLVPLFGTAEGLRKWFDDWAGAFELGVVIGTIILAVATYKLARQAKEDIERGDRPCVYPITPHSWLIEESLGDGAASFHFGTVEEGFQRTYAASSGGMTRMATQSSSVRPLARGITSAFGSAMRSE